MMRRRQLLEEIINKADDDIATKEQATDLSVGTMMVLPNMRIKLPTFTIKETDTVV